MEQMDDDLVTVPADVHAELETLRELGTHDMSEEVLDGLAEHDLDAAFEWIANNPRKYAEGVREGFEPK